MELLFILAMVLVFATIFIWAAVRAPHRSHRAHDLGSYSRREVKETPRSLPARVTSPPQEPRPSVKPVPTSPPQEQKKEDPDPARQDNGIDLVQAVVLFSVLSDSDKKEPAPSAPNPVTTPVEADTGHSSHDSGSSHSSHDSSSSSSSYDSSSSSSDSGSSYDSGSSGGSSE